MLKNNKNAPDVFLRHFFQKKFCCFTDKKYICFDS